MKIILPLIAFLFLYQIAFGDSYDTSYVDKLNNVAFELRRSNLDSSLVLAHKALSISESLQYSQGKALALKLFGVYYWIKGDYDHANEYSYISLRIYEEIGDKDGVVRVLNNIALVDIAQDHFHKAIDGLKKCVEIAESDSNTRMQALANMNLGIAHGCLFEYDKAKQCYINSLALFQSKNDSNGVTDTYAYIGKMYMHLGVYDSSLYYLNTSLVRYKKSNYLRGVIMTSNFLAECYSKIGDTDKTIEFALIAYNQAKRLNLNYDMYDASRLLSENYPKQGKYKEAHQYSEIAQFLNDSLRNEDHVRKITRLEMEYDFEKQMKEKEIVAQNQMKIREYLIIFISLVLLLVVIVGVVFYRNYKKKILLNQILHERNKEILQQTETLEDMNKEMEKLVATKDKFFSIIAHDLMNPLAAFRDVTEYIDDQGDKLSDEEKLEFVHVMKKSSYNLLMLLNNLLTWARSQQGKIKYHPEVIDFSLVASNNVSLFRMTAEKKKIKLDSKVELGTIVKVDEDMMTTVLRNLISNAIKFTEVGGSVEIFSINNDERVEIHVKDNGVGIKDELKTKLFELDRTQSNYGTNSEEGTGLGLIICKEFVDRHGCEIRVESKLGHGSEFIFTLQKTNNI
jgi:signal transduction histidine kinase